MPRVRNGTRPGVTPARAKDPLRETNSHANGARSCPIRIFVTYYRYCRLLQRRPGRTPRGRKTASPSLPRQGLFLCEEPWRPGRTRNEGFFRVREVLCASRTTEARERQSAVRGHPRLRTAQGTDAGGGRPTRS